MFYALNSGKGVATFIALSKALNHMAFIGKRHSRVFAVAIRAPHNIYLLLMVWNAVLMIIKNEFFAW